MKISVKKIPGRKILFLVLEYCAVFAVPLIAGLIVFAMKGIYPFGDKSLICMDLGNQYFPMYVQKANAGSLGSLLYSSSGTLGYNNWAQMAYYSNSLFVPFFRGLDAKAAADLCDWLQIIKPSIGAVTCLMYLKYRFKRNSPVLFAGAAAYALCSWNVAFIAQIMWTDMLFLAPLVLLAYVRLRREKKGILYAILLGITIADNFYVGYALCLFLAVIFVFDIIRLFVGDAYAEKATLDKREVLQDVKRFILYSLLGGALTAVFTLPTLMALGQTAASKDSLPAPFVWYRGFQEYLLMLMPGQKVKIHYDGVNIYTGLCLLLAVPMYFFNSGIRPSKRLRDLAIVILLFLSMNNQLLDFVWHGFHFPNQLPGRWTFAFSLLLVVLACEGILKIGRMKPVGFWVGIMVGAVLMMYTASLTDIENPVPKFYYAIAAAALAAMLVMFAVRTRQTDDTGRAGVSAAVYEKNKKQINSRRLIAGLAVCVFAALQIAESSINYTARLVNPPEEIVFADMSVMDESVSNIQKGGEILTGMEDNAYRTDIFSYFSDNNGIYGDYRGFSRFSSLMAANDYNFFADLGISYYTKNLSILADYSSPVVTSIIGEKYILDATRGLGQAFPALQYMGEGKDIPFTLWMNPYAFPLGFAVSKENAGYQTDLTKSFLERQNELLKVMSGSSEDVYKKLPEDSISASGLQVYAGESWAERYFQTTGAEGGESAEGAVVSTYTVQDDGPVYMNYNYSDGVIDVYRGDQYSHSVQCIPDEGQNVRYACIGSFAAGDRIGLVYHAGDQTQGTFGVDLYEFREQVLAQAFIDASENPLSVTDWQDGHIKG
ncbi:MAG: YfhO family protein, partial [Eubacterium sp.]|nr:YfhO family protein [Eubacterium sp.]